MCHHWTNDEFWCSDIVKISEACHCYKTMLGILKLECRKLYLPAYSQTMKLKYYAQMRSNKNSTKRFKQAPRCKTGQWNSLGILGESKEMESVIHWSRYYRLERFFCVITCVRSEALTRFWSSTRYLHANKVSRTEFIFRLKQFGRWVAARVLQILTHFIITFVNAYIASDQ